MADDSKPSTATRFVRGGWKVWAVALGAAVIAFGLGVWAPIPGKAPALSLDNSILVGILSAIMVLLGWMYHRLNGIEEYNRRLWAWARNLLDLYYRWRRPEAPDPDPLPEP